MSKKVSCLCVTYNRPEFHDFVIYNFQKQTWPEKELIVIDGSEGSFESNFDFPNVRYIYLKNEPNIPRKRNLAIREASGDYVTWFDDDDWQHSKKCEVLINRLERDGLAVGCGTSFFFDLKLYAYNRVILSGKTFFNSIVARKEWVTDMLFDENCLRGSDNNWVLQLERKKLLSRLSFNDFPLFFWICHDKNICNNSQSRYAGKPIDSWFMSSITDDKAKLFSELSKVRTKLNWPSVPEGFAGDEESIWK